MRKSNNSRRSGSPSKQKGKSASSNQSSSECWKFLNSPFVYLVMTVFAAAFFYDFTKGEDSIVYSGVM